MDSAHRETDGEIIRMERKLAKIYGQAEEEIEEKIKKYWERFEKLAEEKQALVAAGELSEEAYQNWLRTQLMTGVRWDNLRIEIAKELYATNQTAMQYVNGTLANIYAINYNFSAAEIQRLSGYAISFDLINKRAVENLVKAGNKSLLPMKKMNPEKDIPWNMGNVNSAVLQGIIQGESIPQIAERVAGVTNANEVSAVRAARTIVTTVENKARHDAGLAAQAKGVVMGKCWIATNDHLTRDWHRDAGNEYGSKDKSIPLDDLFSVGPDLMEYPGDVSACAANLYNCRCTHKNVVNGFTSILPPEKRGKIKVTFNE